MRILRGLSSRFLPCGCLAGVYETYDGEIVSIVDARGPSCADPAHAPGNLVPSDPPAPGAALSPPADSVNSPRVRQFRRRR
ncbi:MAG TPA: hypothetical protein VD833_25820 [Vicinamibacterales bacterium]|nr:hypothetical protein [Vicinamibacterales bacterium]